MTAPTVCFICTGNAARSVMGAALLRAARPDLVITSGGTHSIPGLPMSTRTRDALASVGTSDPDHRSAQADAELIDPAALIVIFEPMHLAWFGRELPEALPRVASLPLLADRLAPGPLDTLGERLEALELGVRAFEDWEEVVDPAGGDVDVFIEAAQRIDGLVTELAGRLGR